MKTPDQFPLRFHGLLGMGFGEWLLLATRSHDEAKAMARQFREFLASFDQAGENHPLKPICKNYSIKTRIEGKGEIYYLRVIIAKPFDLPPARPGK